MMDMTLNQPVHKNLMFQILKDIYSDLSIASFLGFKGGTAAFMFYDLGRFSVDLDFDLLDETQEELVFLKIKQIVGGYGKLKDARKKRFNLFFLLSHDDDSQNIKVEINRRSSKSKFGLKTFLGVSMLVMDQDDMFAHKLVAMNERIGKTNRDIFDVWYFLKNNWPLNRKLIEERTGLSFKKFVVDCIDKLDKISNQSILSGLGELLDNKQKTWVKAKLKSDTLFLLRIMLESEK